MVELARACRGAYVVSIEAWAWAEAEATAELERQDRSSARCTGRYCFVRRAGSARRGTDFREQAKQWLDAERDSSAGSGESRP